MLEVLFASMVISVVLAADDHYIAIAYAIVASQANSIQDWLVVTLVAMSLYIYKGVARAVRG